MAKKILWALICLSITLCGYASQLTATLQSGDKLTPFYGDSAFVYAYKAAVDGDIITLSPGAFYTIDIDKSITIIGAYGFDNDTSKCTRLGVMRYGDYQTVNIKADNVTIEGIRASLMYIRGADNFTLTRSHVSQLEDEASGDKKYHDNTIVTDCRFEVYGAMSLSKNTVIRTCAINYFSDINESSNLALIENCYINTFAYYYNNNRYQPYAIYRNNILRLYQRDTGSHPLNLYQPSEFHNNWFADVSYYLITDTRYAKWTINWNSVVHNNNIVTFTYNADAGSSTFGYDDIYGTLNHKEYPAIPAITSSQIDSETDADGNIHVKISAVARD